MADAKTLKEVACKAIDDAAGELNEVSQEIWSHPEENYEEHHAHKILTDFLERHDFPIQRHHVSATGFRSSYGAKSSPHVTVLCEYDCLPEIGHACGHNLIAEVGVGAAIGIKAAMDSATISGVELGKLTVFGTPAEEGGGGKIDFIKAGEFEGVDAALMSHPANVTAAHIPMMAVDMGTVVFEGRASHAAASPWSGVNALDAAFLAYGGTSVLRQQLKPSWRLHGIIRDGGVKPNIIPERSEMEYYIRAPTMVSVASLREKVTACFQAAAIATGCKMTVKWSDKPFDCILANPTLVELYKCNANAIGLNFSTEAEVAAFVGGSTDMGNVCHVVPGFHPLYSIGGKAMNHTRPFTAVAGSPDAQSYTLTQAKILAMMGIDIFCNPELVDKMHEELAAALAEET